ncbi:MAG: tetratricopeptide repeat protein [Bacteroidales bacterium]|nr:tetratricopeptide repeat protein [Bacteroidales bacterium]
MKRAVLTLFFCLSVLCVRAQKNTELIDAVQLYSDGDYDAAKTAFEILHARDTTDDAVNYYLGMCEYYTGLTASAEKHLKAAVSRDSTNAWYLNTLASLYTATGRSLEAAEICESLVRMQPRFYRNPYTMTLIGDSRLSAGQDSLALSAYQQALDLDPEYAPAEVGKAEIMRIRRNYPGYFLSLGRFVDNVNVSGPAKSNYLKVLLESVDSRFWWVWGEQISRLMSRCVELHPNDIQSHLNELNIHFIKNDTTAWMAECEKIIPLASEQKDTSSLMQALNVIGDTRYAMGDRKGAYETYEKALKVNPNSAAVLNNYAYFLSEEGKQLKKALKMSRRAIDIEPDNAVYLDTYGWLLFLMKKPKEAKPHFKRAMIFGGKENSVVLEHYSLVLDALGEKELANYYKNLSEQRKNK